MTPKAPCRDLRELIARLETCGELVRVKAQVDPNLEITEITDRVSKSMGPALLFENVTGSTMPVLINAFGSDKRMAIALNVHSIKDIVDDLSSFLEMDRMKKGLIPKIKMAKKLIDLARIPPKRVQRAECQSIVLTENLNLFQLPILKCWPKDGGRFITMPMVISNDPDTGIRNVGMYRMQVLDERTTAMHWQTQKDGSVQAYKSKLRGQKLNAAVAIGADPISVFSAVAPLPYGVDEFLFSGYLRKKSLEVIRCKTIDVEVPASSEIVLEGYVDPEDLRKEGPFGDHTGVYTPPELFPAFHVTCMTMREKPIYQTTIVGKPPMEDTYMGKAIEKIFLPVLKKQLPELVDMNFPEEGTFNNAVIVSIDKTYPFHARKIAHAIWGLGQLSYTKVVIVVDKSVNVHDIKAVALNVFNNIDPKRDCFFVEGPVDTLNHASDKRDYGSKMGIDATTKWKEEGYIRQWPDEIEMDATIQEKVRAKWSRYGIPG